MLGELVRAPNNRKALGIIEEEHVDRDCPDGIEGCKGHPVVIDWSDLRQTTNCSAAFKWMPRRKVWRFRYEK